MKAQRLLRWVPAGAGKHRAELGPFSATVQVLSSDDVWWHAEIGPLRGSGHVSSEGKARAVCSRLARRMLAVRAAASAVGYAP